MLIYDIKIFSPDFGKRAFITITIDGKRYKEYNGNRINVNLKPNNAKTLKERNQLLKQLEFEYRKRLENGTYQQLVSSPNETYITEDLLKMALQKKLHSNLSPKYSKALTDTCNSFISLLIEKERASDIRNFNTKRI